MYIKLIYVLLLMILFFRYSISMDNPSDLPLIRETQ